jgi:radical SAM protein with 4Fe4S-binding SPASM domain
MNPKLDLARSICLLHLRAPSFPLKCSLAVTYRCNMRCSMCNIWKKKSERSEVLPGDVAEFFRKAPQFKWVGFTGGEPFLRPDLEEMIEAVTRYAPDLAALSFTTNGFLHEAIIRTMERWLRRRPSCLFIVIVSIDGDRELHDSIRGVAGAWEQAVQTFCALKSLPGIKTELGFTLSSRNVGRFAGMYEAVKARYPRLRFDDININVFQKSSFYYENMEMEGPDTQALLAQLRQIRKMDRDSFSINNFLRRTYLALYPAFLRKGRTPLPCQALSSTLFIDPYGDLYPCAVFKARLASLHDMDQPLKQLWTGTRAREIRRLCRASICPACWSPCDAFNAISGSLVRSLGAYVSRHS